MKQLRSLKMRLALLMLALLASAGFSLFASPRVQAVLPPRPTVTTPQAEEDDDDEEAVATSVAAMGQIYLQVTPADQPYWAVVQWQDSAGRWHDVTQWQGELRGGAISWWVAEQDFGKGPFRWAIYPPGGQMIDQGGGRFIYRGEQHILAVSQPFHLPSGSSLSSSVIVTIPLHEQ